MVLYRLHQQYMAGCLIMVGMKNDFKVTYFDSPTTIENIESTISNLFEVGSRVLFKNRIPATCA